GKHPLVRRDPGSVVHERRPAMAIEILYHQVKQDGSRRIRGKLRSKPGLLQLQHILILIADDKRGRAAAALQKISSQTSDSRQAVKILAVQRGFIEAAAETVKLPRFLCDRVRFAIKLINLVFVLDSSDFQVPAPLFAQLFQTPSE